jgi:hypothetical protein
LGVGIRPRCWRRRWSFARKGSSSSDPHPASRPHAPAWGRTVLDAPASVPRDGDGGREEGTQERPGHPRPDGGPSGRDRCRGRSPCLPRPGNGGVCPNRKRAGTGTRPYETRTRRGARRVGRAYLHAESGPHRRHHPACKHARPTSKPTSACRRRRYGLKAALRTGVGWGGRWVSVHAADAGDAGEGAGAAEEGNHQVLVRSPAFRRSSLLRGSQRKTKTA